MKKSPLFLISILVVLVAIVMITSSAFAYIIKNSDGTNSITLSTADINPEIKFSIDKNVRGIPGEVMPISTENYIITNSPSDNIVFKVTYIIDEHVSFIDNIYLERLDTNLIKDPNSTDKCISYYGVIKKSDDKTFDLGNLLACFVVPDENSPDDYNVTVEFTACQQTESAIHDYLGIEAIGEFSALLD